jgi:hypothetical protein
MEPRFRRAFDPTAVARQFLVGLPPIVDSLADDIASRNPPADGRHEATTLLIRLLALTFLEKVPAFSQAAGQALRLEAGGSSPYRLALAPLFRHLADPASPIPVPGRALFTLDDRSAGLDVDSGRLAALVSLLNRFDFTLRPAAWPDTDVALEPEILGRVFEQCLQSSSETRFLGENGFLGRDRRKTTGSFFTPQPIVQFMCRQALRACLAETDNLSDDALDRLFDDDLTAPLPFDPSQAARLRHRLATITVVDPAAGAGAFLVGMLAEMARLIRRLDRAASGPETVERPGYGFEIEQAIVGRCLYGVDLHELAVAICQFRLGLSVMAELTDGGPEACTRVREVLAAVDRHVRCGDSISDFHSPNPQSAIRNPQSGGFDVVITNPPYGADLAGSGGPRQRPDSYVRFIELGTRLARPGGVGCFIVPTSWESGERYRALRQLLLDRVALRLVVNLPYAAFPDACVDNAIVLFVNRPPLPSATYQAVALPKRLGGVDFRSLVDFGSLRPVPLSLVHADPQRRVVFELLAATLALRFAAPGFVPLGEITDSTIGILASKHPIRPGPPPGPGWLPYFVGNVYRFRVTRQRLDAVYLPGPQARFHRGPRIAVRRVVSRANRMLCAMMTDDCVIKKDLYSFVLRPERAAGLDLWYLLALLNSALFSYLYLARSAVATRDDFRQLTLIGLRELPVSRVPPARQQPLADLARQLTGLAAEGRAGTPGWQALDQHLEEAVFDLYGLSTDEREAVLNWLARSG